MTDDALISRLQQEIDEIGRDVPSAMTGAMALNEADTESAVVEPLLRTLGYGRLEFSRQSRDRYDGSRPDYTLLPGTPSQWFLEVKKLNLPLSDSHAAQVVQYAVNQGARWAVLTNGRAWWIYRAHLEKPLSEKRVLQVTDLFAGPEAVAMLAFLSRDAMASDALSAWWIQEQTRQIIRRELENPESSTRHALRRLVSDTIHHPVSEAQIADVLAPLLLPIALPSPTPVSKTAPVSPSPPSSAGKILTLSQWKASGTRILGTKPAAVEFADGGRSSLSSWADVAACVVAHYGAAKLPPLPFVLGKGKNCFLNTTPAHTSGKKMHHWRQVTAGVQDVYVDTNRSAELMIRSLCQFLTEIGVSADDVTVHLA